MIRVNLLPIRQARRRSQGKTQLFLFAALLGVVLLACGALWGVASAELTKTEAKVRQFRKDVEAAKKEVADATKLEKEKEVFEKKLEVLSQLERDRTGPVRMMDEFQSVLSPPRNEEDRFAKLKKNWDVDWDTRRVWINSLDEKGGSFTIQGGAADSNDVAEFLRRMISTQHFDKVELDYVQSAGGKDGSYVEFTIFGKILYQPKKIATKAEKVKKKKGKKPSSKKKTPKKKGS